MMNIDFAGAFVAMAVVGAAIGFAVCAVAAVLIWLFGWWALLAVPAVGLLIAGLLIGLAAH